MSDVDREHLTIPSAHSIFPKHHHHVPGSYTGTTITSASAAPPFAPRPIYNQRTHGTAPSSRSGGTSTHTDHIPPSAASSSTTECTCHEVCYYLQQAIFILAIMTGIALTIAGTVIHLQSGELLVFVFIGVLLTMVNGVLLINLCFTRRNQKRRMRARAQNTQTSQTAAMVRYKNTEKASVTQALMGAPSLGSDMHYPHFHGQASAQPPFQEFPMTQNIFAQSPSESQMNILQSVPYQRSGSMVSHHRYIKNLYQKSPPLGQYHRPLLNTLGPQRQELGPQVKFSPSAPPPSYDDLLRTGRLPQEGTIVHLI